MLIAVYQKKCDPYIFRLPISYRVTDFNSCNSLCWSTVWSFSSSRNTEITAIKMHDPIYILRLQCCSARAIKIKCDIKYDKIVNSCNIGYISNQMTESNGSQDTV